MLNATTSSALRGQSFSISVTTPRQSSRASAQVWDLPLSFANAEENHTPADVAELTDHIGEVYGRPPFIVPEEENI